MAGLWSGSANDLLFEENHLASGVRMPPGGLLGLEISIWPDLAHRENSVKPALALRVETEK